MLVDAIANSGHITMLAYFQPIGPHPFVLQPLEYVPTSGTYLKYTFRATGEDVPGGDFMDWIIPIALSCIASNLSSTVEIPLVKGFFRLGVHNLPVQFFSGPFESHY